MGLRRALPGARPASAAGSVDFNRDLQRASVTASWADPGVTGSQPVRDLWQQRDLSASSNQFTVAVPAHGAVLISVERPGRDSVYGQELTKALNPP
jgi:hypothetical protein